MNVIRQTVYFKASAARLYDIYLQPRLHGAMTGMPVTIGGRPGSRFKAFNGMITGKTLLAVPKSLIVQQWRSAHFGDRDPDSLLTLTFADTAKGGRIDLLHVGVPDIDLRGVQRGWNTHYWKPLRAYLGTAARKSAKKSAKPPKAKRT